MGTEVDANKLPLLGTAEVKCKPGSRDKPQWMLDLITKKRGGSMAAAAAVVDAHCSDGRINLENKRQKSCSHLIEDRNEKAEEDSSKHAHLNCNHGDEKARSHLAREEAKSSTGLSLNIIGNRAKASRRDESCFCSREPGASLADPSSAPASSSSSSSLHSPPTGSGFQCCQKGVNLKQDGKFSTGLRNSCALHQESLLYAQQSRGNHSESETGVNLGSTSASSSSQLTVKCDSPPHHDAGRGEVCVVTSNVNPVSSTNATSLNGLVQSRKRLLIRQLSASREINLISKEAVAFNCFA